MKKLLQRLTVCLVIVASFFVGGLIGIKNIAYASIDSGGTWYYSQLSNQEKIFYDALKSAYDTELLMSGTANLDVTDPNIVNNTLSQSEIKDYVLNGNNIIMASFERAKVAFKYDLPQSTFIDFDKLCLTVGSIEEVSGTKFSAIIGSGKYDNYYAQGYTSKEQVVSLLSNVTSKVNEIIVELREQPTLDKKLKQIQSILTDRVVRIYDYQTSQDVAQYINSAYGALVLGYADAEGYARAYSMVLNKLGVENIIVCGNVMLKDYNISKWAWNNVKYGGNWYGIDSALDDNETKLQTMDNFLLGSEFNQVHYPVTNSVVPASAFRYPTLSVNNYQHDMQFWLQSTKAVDGKHIFKQFSKITLAYDGKGVEELEQDGLYLVVRTQYLTQDENPQLAWTDWFSIKKYLDTDTYYNNKDYPTYFEFDGSSYSNQFAITDVDITTLSQDQFIDEDISQDNLYNYNKLVDFDENNYFVDISDTIKGQVKDRETVMPTVDQVSPSQNKFLYQNTICNISIVYDQPLAIKPGFTEKTISVKAITNPEQAITNSVISNVDWDGSNTIKFTFLPASFYQQDYYTCEFVIEGLYGHYSHIDPQTVSYQVCTYKQAINNAVNLDNFYFSAQAVVLKDNNSTYKTTDQTINSDDSNLALASAKISETNAQSLKNLIEINLGKSADHISMYNLDLYLSGLNVQPNDTATVVFNYPTSTKHSGSHYYLYSFTINNGAFTPQQEQVVATDYGLVATLDHIGIHAIAEVSGEQSSTNKIIYASADNNGSIDRYGIEQLAIGGGITYNITKNAGYTIRKIMLNNNLLPLNASMLNNSVYQLVLTNSQLDNNNDLRVEFVAETSKQNFASLGLNVALKKCYNQTPTILSHPQNVNVTKGKELTLSVKCSTNSYAELTYQWYKDGELIQGATDSTYTTKAVQQTQGEYYVQVISTIGDSVIVVDSAKCKVSLNNYAVVWFLAIFFALVVIVSLFVLIVNKKLKLPTIKAD